MDTINRAGDNTTVPKTIPAASSVTNSAVTLIRNPYAKRVTKSAVAIHNPYIQQKSPVPSSVPAPVRPSVPPNPHRNSFEKMMEASRNLKPTNKKKRKAIGGDPNKTKTKTTTKGNKDDNQESTTASEMQLKSTSNKKQKTTRITKTKKKDEEDDEVDAEGAPNFRTTWSKTAQMYLDAMLKRVKDAVYFEERGRHELQGAWPQIHYRTVISATDDPMLFCQVISKDANNLQREDFVLPDVMFWSPERRWPELYPAGRPCCPFHPGKTSCVEHLGWTAYPRRTYDHDHNIALFTTKYRCTENEQYSIHPYTFHGTAASVLCQAPRYVQAYWKQNGFRLTQRAAVKISILEEMRSLMANGSGAAGYHHSLVEKYKRRHWSLRKMWTDYSKWRYARLSMSADLRLAPPVRECFFDFDDDEYDTNLPSLSYLLQLTIEDIERCIPYYNRKMQMEDGQNLSTDHSHKVAKVVLIQSEHGFVGLYTVMNEFGKILGFWFVNGTTLVEVEDALRGLAKRYRMHGFRGPTFLTTDRCCTEREFFAGTNNKEKKPVFPSLLGNLAVNDNQIDEANTMNGFKEVRVLALPTAPISPQTKETANTTAADIVKRCRQNNWNVVAVDCEWKVPYKPKRPGLGLPGPDVVQLGLPDGSTYIFHIACYGEFPKGLKKIIETATIQKVAHNASAEASKLRDAGVSLTNFVDTGHMAFYRGVSDRRRPRLEELVKNLFGCILEKEPGLRLSDWSSTISEEQRGYAARDAYATMAAYQQLIAMPYVDATAIPAPNLVELSEGTSVLLYTKNISRVVAHGVVVKGNPDTGFNLISNRGYIKVRVTEDAVQIPSALFTLGKSRDGKSKNQSFQDYFQTQENSGFLEIQWKLSHLRKNPIASQEPSDKVNVVTEIKRVPLEDGDDDDGKDDGHDNGTDDNGTDDNGNADANEESNTCCNNNDSQNGNINNDDSSSNVDHDDYFLRDCSKNVKNDLEHIFLRFARVLLKSHSAFGAFMARLSDSFFVPSQEDIAFIKQALRKAGFSDNEIKAKPWNYFKRRVR